MKSKYWLTGWFLSVGITLGGIAFLVYSVDPYMHYHRPNTEKYFYILNHQRMQNDGITKHFDYDAVITGTSMTENFKNSELDELFDVKSIKVTYSGGSYKEINDNLIVAFQTHPHLKVIVRGLDIGYFINNKDRMRGDLGTYPTHLYNSNPFDDVFYLFNKDVIFSRAYKMIKDTKEKDFKPGITPFDTYSRWQDRRAFGVKSIFHKGFKIQKPKSIRHLTEQEKKTIYENVTQNVTSLADQHPEDTFYYFFTPYSIAWWLDNRNNGTIYRQLEAEQYVIELILEHPNIRLFSFDNRTDIITNLNHYKDAPHYGEWVNSFILRAMRDDKYRLTKKNYREYLAQKEKFLTTFDYASLTGQEDYECDDYAGALLNREITGAVPLNLWRNPGAVTDMAHATIIADDADRPILLCESEANPSGAAVKISFAGLKMKIEDMTGYRYLIFNGKRIRGDGVPVVTLCKEDGTILAKFSPDKKKIDDKEHTYSLRIPPLQGPAILSFDAAPVQGKGKAFAYQFIAPTLY